MTTASKTHRFVFLGALAAVAALLLASAASASAEVRWSVESEHGPQNLVPGQEAQYSIRAFNVGDSATSEPFAIDVTLPSQVTATEVVKPSEWNCGSLPASGTIHCVNEGTVNPPAKSATARGNAEPLNLEVSVGALAAGSANTTSTVSGGEASAVPASVTDPALFGSSPTGFGFSHFSGDVFDTAAPTAGGGGSPVRQAGAHPFEQRIDFGANLTLREVSPENGAIPSLHYTTPAGHIHTLQTRLPAGLIGNPQATPRCDPLQLNRNVGAGKGSGCPTNTEVGSADLLLQDGVGVDFAYDTPVYNMIPPEGYVAAFVIEFQTHPSWILIELDPTDHYSVVATVKPMTESLVPRRIDMTLWGVPGDPAHNPLRINPANGSMNAAFTGAPIKPFLTLPGQCDEPAGSFEQRADSWEEQGAFIPWAKGTSIQASGCEDPRFQFEPSISIQPTSHEAATPTGLNVDLTLPQKNDELAEASEASKLYSQNGEDIAINTPPLRDAVTHLPPGMAVNPSAADGLSGCSEAQVGLGTNEPPTCPDSSKLGTVEIESPLVPDTLKGFIYQARQFENPHHSLLGFYTVAEGDGLSIKLAAEVVADPQTGNLTTIYRDNPQLTFSHYRLHFWGGQRAPLVNPPSCGEYQGSGTFTSWNSSLPAVTSTDATHITAGPDGSACPSGQFDPHFKAGSANPIAGAFSPFALEVSREDGTQGLAKIETTLPAGTLAKLAGVPYCPEAALAAIPTALGSGAGERANPSCPAASLVGHTDAGAGAGLPFHNPGNVYLAGPYKGAPLSLAVVTPVIGGPLDLGNVLTRVALYVDPTTAQVRAVSDPLPSMIAGIPLDLRSVRVSMDRPQFTLNPTSCEPSAVTGRIGGLAGATAGVSDRFQVGACAALAFKPKLSLSLKGKTTRAQHPALKVVLTMKPGEANIAAAQVTLPHSAFLDQSHIGTVCTRVQFAAHACPAASVYGHATANTPLLDQPLSGRVYLRSSSHKLPDLVADLNGQIEVTLDGKVDTGPGGGIRNTFEVVPDAPVTRFTLSLMGGSRGLIVNSENVCTHPEHAVALFDAQNGKVHDFEPVVQNSCRKHPRKHKGHRHKRRH